MTRADPADELGATLVAPKLGMMYVPATSPSIVREQMVGHLDTDLRTAFAGGPHRGARLVWDGDPGHFVVQELGVARGHERKHAEQEGTGTQPGPNRRRASSSIASTCSTE